MAEDDAIVDDEVAETVSGINESSPGMVQMNLPVYCSSNLNVPLSKLKNVII